MRHDDEDHPPGRRRDPRRPLRPGRRRSTSCKVTCGDFAKSDSQSLTNVSLWLSGYYMGEDDDAVIDFDRVNKMGNALVQYCAANPKEPVSDAAEKLMGKAK